MTHALAFLAGIAFTIIAFITFVVWLSAQCPNPVGRSPVSAFKRKGETA